VRGIAGANRRKIYENSKKRIRDEKEFIREFV
jgi:hypothetical protein